MSEPEGTRLAAQLGDAVGGPEVPADPETEAVDLRRKLWNGQRLGESMAEDRDETVRRCGEQVLAVLGDAALPVAAVLTLPPDEFAALRSVAVMTGLLPASAPDRTAADITAVEAAAAVLERRYPGTRPERLDTVLEELRAVARAWRRQAAEAGKRSEEGAGNG